MTKKRARLSTAFPWWTLLIIAGIAILLFVIAYPRMMC